MLPAFVCALLAFPRASCGDSSPWFLGCFQVSSAAAARRLQAGGGVRDLDPAGCSVRCLDEGYQVAALSPHTCYCGNRLNGFVVTECFDTSSDGRTKAAKRGSERQSSLEPPLPQEGHLVLYRSEGPVLHSVTVCPRRTRTGDALVLAVSGRLAGRPRQPTGIEALEGTSFSEVTVELRGTKGQSSRRVKVLSDGSLAESTLEAPGNGEIVVRVSNVLSTLSATFHLSVSQTRPGSSIHGVTKVNDTEVTCLCETRPSLSAEQLHKHLDTNPPKNLVRQLDNGADRHHLASPCCCHGDAQSHLHADFHHSPAEQSRRLSPRAAVMAPLQTANGQNKTVRILTAKQAYPTNAEITFQAVVEDVDPAEFVWRFGDSTTAKTNSKTVTKRYRRPGSYEVVVEASGGGATVSSEAFPLVVQTAARLNRLVHRASVLRGHAARLSCRVDAGTNLSFAWSFGDGATGAGRSAEEEHVFGRTGEFRVEVTASNRVSSASLSSHVFVVDRPCQPPPVKNMGPRTLKVRRYEVIRLGVTYDGELECGASEGLRYSWTLLDSGGRVVALPPSETHGQSVTLPSFLLRHDTYAAVAKVQVAGSQVYGKYSVRLQVMASQPVAFIQGGTNVFISRSGAVILDGGASYDPDFPTSPLSFSWTCKPVSSISTSCFHRHVGASAPALRFPAAFLKRDFDQFHFTLTVRSGGRSASAETFVTVSPNSVRSVSIHCRGDRLTWDQPFSVSASCEDCETPEGLVQYSWSLQQVDAPSRPAADAPFCHSADLGAPSAVVRNPTQQEQLRAATSRNKRRSGAGPPQPEPPAGPLDLDDNCRLYLEHSARSDAISEFPADGEVYLALLESGAAGGREDADYDVHFAHAEEGEPGMSAGRPSGVEGGGGFPAMLHPSPTEEEEEFSKLVAPKPSLLTRAPTLLDLPRDPVSRGLFESFTYSGISSSALRFKPFSLRPMSRYMLEVTAKSQNISLGRAQLFVRTGAAPGGVACRVQPGRGTELATLFSVFCTSGREDFLYQYSYSVGGKPPRTLYRGRDFQYYFSLPAGDPRDDLKVTVYTEIWSSADGSATKPCPVSVQVWPSFLRNASSSSHHPDEELSEWGQRNLSDLLQLGNHAETRNYISLLSGVLNRLAVDSEGAAIATAAAPAQRRLRNLLVHTACNLPSGGEAAASDSISLLEDLLMVTHQVTFSSARRVTAHVQQISEQFTDQKTLGALIGLLSFGLEAVTRCETPASSARRKHAPESDFRDDVFDVRRISTETSATPKRAERLVEEILRTASALTLKSLLPSNESQQVTVHAGLLSLNAAPQSHTPGAVAFGSSSFDVPAALIQAAFRHRRQPACVLRVLTELRRSPYGRTTFAAQLNGPVVELSLYSCSTRRRIPVRALVQPVNAVLALPQRNNSAHHFKLQRGRVNYHSFNISQELLRHAVQVSVLFTPPPNDNKAFPVTLLFSMFERPTPSMHHLSKTHQWKNSTTRITLLPSYLNAAGVAHLALLAADFEKTGRTKRRSEPVSYSVSVVSSLCLSWSVQQGAWTHQGCRTQQRDSGPAVNCSCRLLRPLTVVQQEIQSSFQSADVDPLLSASSDPTVLCVLSLVLVLSVPAWAACRRADAASEGGRGVHFLSDNSPSDQHLYLVTVHTGLRSAARMSAKVYVVLHGEDGVSQTKELQVPGCTLFRRNSQDSFILSAASSLGAVRGAHIWHDTSGPSPDWYLSRVEVSELSVGHEERRSWLIGGQCWLSANIADGRVERMLRATDEDSSFSKMLSLKLSDYFADFHIWASVFICPSPSSLSHTQRLSVCLQLLSGYACVNAVLISQMDLYLGLESSFLGLSPVSVLTGLASVAVVLPVATWTAFLFRRRGAKPTGSGALHAGSRETEKDDRKDVRPVSDARFEPNLPSFDLHQYTQEASMNKHQDIDRLSSFPGSKGSVTEHVIPPDATLREEDAPSRRSDAGPASRRGSQGVRRLQTATCGHSEGAGNAHKPEGRSGLACRWSRRWTWTFCLLWSFCCLLLAAVQGTRFGSGDVQLWLHALLVSLACCVFLVHPAVIVAAAATASCRLCGAPRLHRPSSRSHVHSEAVKQWSHDAAAAAAKQHREPLGPPASSARSRFYLEKRLEARRRARFLRHVRPPAAATLRKTSRKRRRDELIHQTLRELSVSASMLVLLMCVASGCSHTAVAKPFIRTHQEAFMSVHTREQWWTWTQTRLLDSLYPSAPTEKRVLVGDPILQKTEGVFQSLVSMETPPGTCSHLGCSPGPSVTVVLGRTRSDAASKLKRLESGGWLDGATVALEVQFTLYSPAADLFTSVSLLAERSPSGALRPSARVRSARVRRAPAAWDGAVQVCQVLFLLLSLLRLCLCLSSVWRGGLTGHWRRPGSWAEVALLTVALTYHVHDFHHASCVTEVAELLRSRSSSRPVDVGQLAACEQFLRALRGVLLLLLTLKCATVLSAIRTFGASTAALTHSLSGFLWLVVSGLILLAASSFGGNLLYGQNSQAFGSLPRSLQTLLRHFWGTRTTPGLVHSGSESLYWTILRLSSTFVWTAAVLAVFSSFVREAKKSRRKWRETFTLTELMVYVRKRLPGIKKQQEQPTTENPENWFLQECESLVDELLLRLDSLAGDSPPGSSMDTQSTVRSQMCMTESTSVSNQEDVAHSTHKFRLNIDVSSEDGFEAKTRLSPSNGTRKHRTGDDPEEQSEQETRGIQTEVLVEVLVHDAPARLQEYECAESL